jgi:hypothetical protein
LTHRSGNRCQIDVDRFSLIKVMYVYDRRGIGNRVFVQGKKIVLRFIGIEDFGKEQNGLAREKFQRGVKRT